MEIRDNDPLRYLGKGVLQAVETVNTIISAPKFKMCSKRNAMVAGGRVVELR